MNRYRNNILKYIELVFIGVFFITLSCTNSKNLSDENLKRAIDNYLLKNPLVIEVSNFPKEIKLNSHSMEMSQLEDFVKVGFLFKVEEKKMVSKIMNFKTKKVEATFLKYDLTPEEKRKYIENRGFSFGIARVKEIVYFSEPTDYFGEQMRTTVSYKYVVTEIDDWVEETQFKNTLKIKKAKSSIKKPIRGNAGLILINGDWIHQV